MAQTTSTNKASFKPGVSCLVKVVVVCCILAGCSSSSGSHASRASELVEEGKFKQARIEYSKHIEARLKTVSRPPDENPYFYLVKIGDTYLSEGNLEKAEELYSSALKKGIQPDLLGSRFRDLATSYFDNRNNYVLAFKVLRTYRHLDDLLFDSLLDELQKKTLTQKTAG